MRAALGFGALLLGANADQPCVPGKVKDNLVQPIGVAVDSKDNVYIADSMANVVYKCAHDGQCEQFSSGWNWPEGIAVGADDTVYVSAGDDNAPIVKKCTPSGECTPFGKGWNSPRGMTVGKSGDIFITNAYGDMYGVWKCSPSGSCTIIGDSHKWPHYPPECVAVDSSNNVYVTGGDEDEGNSNYVKKCDADGKCAAFSGNWPKGGGYDNPIAVDSHDNIYIADSGTKTLKKCTPAGECENLTVPNFGSAGGDMAFGSNGALYVSQDKSVMRFCLQQSPVVV